MTDRDREPTIGSVLLAVVFVTFLAVALLADVPLRWTVQAERVQPVTFDAVKGETLALEAAFTSYGRPFQMAGKPCAIFWQTNGMGSAWWQGEAAASSNRVTATFTPAMNPGADQVRGYIGSTGDIYRAAFAIRFKDGPGAVPNVIEQPPRVLDLAHTVVINPAWPTHADFAATTTAMRVELKEYVDGQIARAGVVSPSVVTNIAGGVTTATVTKAYVEGLGISAGMTTNDVVGIVSGKRDMTNRVWECGYTTNTVPAGVTDLRFSPECEGHSNLIVTFNYAGMECIYEYVTDPEWTSFTMPRDEIGVDPDYLPGSWPFDFDVTVTRVRKNVMLALDSEIAAATNGLYSASSGNALAAQVSAIGTHLNAEDAKFVVTNYNSVTRMPEAYVEIKLPDQSWSRIWSEMTRFNWMTNAYLPTNYATKAEVDEKADRAWGYYDSHSGSYAPEGYTWISSPKIAIAADLAYQRTITSEGEIWVLCSQGMVTETGGTTNGFFRISDSEGNVAFEIMSGSKRTVGATATNLVTLAGYAPTKMRIAYQDNSDAHPTIEACTSLTNLTWKKETDADSLVNVSWSGTSGHWVAEVQAKAAQPQLFVKASYEAGGETIVRNAAPVSLTHVYIGGVKYAVGTATIGGQTVMTLTPAN